MVTKQIKVTSINHDNQTNKVTSINHDNQTN